MAGRNIYLHRGERYVGDSGDTSRSRTRIRPAGHGIRVSELPAGVTVTGAATGMGMTSQSLAKWFVKSGQSQTPPNRRSPPALYVLC
jgi:hypothetical protein